MRLSQYQQLALRTESSDNPKFKNHRLLHASLGIVTEVAEYIYESDTTLDLREEIGDCFWYISLACAALKLNIEDVSQEPVNGNWINYPKFFKRKPLHLSPKDSLEYWSAFLADKLKRHYFYNEELHYPGLSMVIGQLMYDLMLEAGPHLPSILESNIAKLKVRYPGNYSDLDALNRNLSKEKNIFN